MLLGLAMPGLLTIHDAGVYPTLLKGIRETERLYVLVAASQLVALNTLRCFPHYLGAFFLVESVETPPGFLRTLLSAVVVCASIPPIYLLIELFYGVHYDFGVPAVLMIAMLIVLGKIRFDFVDLSKKALMVAMLVAAFQVLDVMPALRGLPFGRGEASFDIKLASGFLSADPFLQGAATILFLMLLFTSVLLLKLITDENNLKRLNELKEHNERMLMETRMRILEQRTDMELQQLVHDLKSPLASMQALVGVVKFGCARGGNRQQDLAYLTKIEDSIERISGMISEILYESHRTRLGTQEVLDALLAQVSIAEYAGLLTTSNDAPGLTVEVNKIRVLRALTNLLENSFYAVDPAQGVIALRIGRAEKDGRLFARFSVCDNGRGIPAALIDSIWKKGFSTRSSHGLGLSFAENVIRNNDGTISIYSTEGEGTVVEVLIPAGERAAAAEASPA